MRSLAYAAREETLRINSKLYQQGTPAEALYVIVSGHAHVGGALRCAALLAATCIDEA